MQDQDPAFQAQLDEFRNLSASHKNPYEPPHRRSPLSETHSEQGDCVDDNDEHYNLQQVFKDLQSLSNSDHKLNIADFSGKVVEMLSWIRSYRLNLCLPTSKVLKSLVNIAD